MDPGGDLLRQDSLSYRGSWLGAVDPRTKCLFTLACLVLALSAQDFLFPIALILLSLLGLLGLELPWRLLILRLVPPTGIVLTILLFHLLFGGRDALRVGLLLAAKAWAGVLLILLLGISTPFSQLIRTGRWMRLSPTFLEILGLTYRYLFLLLEEALRVKQAQAARLGYGAARIGLESLGILMGVLMLRLPDRAEAIHQAMSARGYEEGTFVQGLQPFRRRDAWQAALLGLCLLFLLFLRFYPLGMKG